MFESYPEILTTKDLQQIFPKTKGPFMTCSKPGRFKASRSDEST